MWEGYIYWTLEQWLPPGKEEKVFKKGIKEISALSLRYQRVQVQLWFVQLMHWVTSACWSSWLHLGKGGVLYTPERKVSPTYTLFPFCWLRANILVILPSYWRVAKYATLGQGLFWTKDNWEADIRKDLSPSLICLRAGHTFAKVSQLPSLATKGGG